MFLRLCLGIALVYALLLPTPIHAEGGMTYTVTRLDDPAPDICLPADCSLREAIIAANTTVITDTIDFALDGTVELTIAPTGDNDATTGDLNVEQSLILQGRGATTTGIDANQLDRVIATIDMCAKTCPLLAISDLTITGGQVTGNGGGVYITRATLNRVIVQNNSATNYGGGVYGDSYTITNSAVVSNSATYGGGLAVHGGGYMIVDTVTVSGNSASANGGGIVTIGMPKILIGPAALIENSTVVLNSSNAGAAGAGIGSHLMNGLAEHSIRPGNTIVAFNSGGVQCGPLDQGSPTSPNLTTDGSCEATLIGDPHIGPLANNGGDTLTHALGTNSPALDAGTCDTTSDQRGLPRPVDLAGYPNTENGCDIGAWEAQTIPPTAVTIESWTVRANPDSRWQGILGVVGIGILAGWLSLRPRR